MLDGAPVALEEPSDVTFDAGFRGNHSGSFIKVFNYPSFLPAMPNYQWTVHKVEEVSHFFSNFHAKNVIF